MTAKSATATIKAIKKDPELKKIIDQAKKMVNWMAPVVEQVKQLDLDKLQEEWRPLLEAVKKIDPETIEELVETLRELANGFRKKLEKPKIPEPD